MLLRGLWIAILCSAFSCIIIGCHVPQDRFFILRNVPESPSFVVIPANNYLSQVMFANEIEEAIISAGVKVVMFSQATKEVTKEVTVGAGLQAIEGDQAARKSGTGKLTEKSVELSEGVTADYIVYTYANSKQIRIIKRQTREILTVLNLSENLYREKENKIAYRRKLVVDALVSMGIPIIYTHKQGSLRRNKAPNPYLIE